MKSQSNSVHWINVREILAESQMKGFGRRLAIMSVRDISPGKRKRAIVPRDRRKKIFSRKSLGRDFRDSSRARESALFRTLSESWAWKTRAGNSLHIARESRPGRKRRKKRFANTRVLGVAIKHAIRVKMVMLMLCSILFVHRANCWVGFNWRGFVNLGNWL